MSLSAVFLLLAATAQPTKERLADLFWDSCVDQKPFPIDAVEGNAGDLPKEMRKRFEGASVLEVRKGPGNNGVNRYLLVRATFVPAQAHVLRRCVLVSLDWKAQDADQLVNARAEKIPYSAVKPMTMSYMAGASNRYLGGQRVAYTLGWVIGFEQDGNRGRAEYVRLTNLRAQELLAKERAREAQYQKSKKAGRK